MTKKPFLLLEILIAFFLVALCIAPLMKYPLEMVRLEIEQLEEIEKERLADWTFTEIKEMLLKNEIPWKKLPEKGEKSDPFSLPPAQIQLSTGRLKKVQRSFILTGRGIKTGKNGEEYRQLGVFIDLDGKTYQFRLPVKKIYVAK